MKESSIAVCAECGSNFKSACSPMAGLCPECAHWLYGYANCSHEFENGICAKCLWNGQESDYVHRLKENNGK